MSLHLLGADNVGHGGGGHGGCGSRGGFGPGWGWGYAPVLIDEALVQEEPITEVQPEQTMNIDAVAEAVAEKLAQKTELSGLHLLGANLVLLGDDDDFSQASSSEMDMVFNARNAESSDRWDSAEGWWRVLERNATNNDLRGKYHRRGDAAHAKVSVGAIIGDDDLSSAPDMYRENINYALQSEGRGRWANAEGWWRKLQQAAVEPYWYGVFQSRGDAAHTRTITTVMGATALESAIADFKVKLAKVQPVTIAVARNLLTGGDKYCEEALEIIKDRGSKTWMTPEAVQREQSHLDWHKAEIDRQAHGKDENATPYTSADDLKKYVLTSFTEMMTAQDEAALQDQISSQMWNEIGQSLADQTLRAAESVQNITSAAASGVTSTLSSMKWVIIIGLTAAAAVGGLILYKKLSPGLSVAVARRMGSRI